MRVCDLTTPLGGLARAAKKLRESWSIVEAEWSDSVATDFSLAHVSPLLTEVSQAAAAIERFQEVLRKAERECGEESEPV